MTEKTRDDVESNRTLLRIHTGHCLLVEQRHCPRWLNNVSNMQTR